MVQFVAVSNRENYMLKKLAFGLIVGVSATPVFAQTVTNISANANSAYAQDSRGTVMRNTFGLCWRTGYWTPADTVAGCDGDLLPPVVINPTAPAIVVPTTVVQASNAPAAPSTPKRCDFTVTLAGDQAFAFDKDALTNAAKKHIDEVRAKLSGCSKIEIIMITGHTDRIGSQQYNQKLSDKRADAVAAYMKSQGVTAPIDTLGMGKTQSIKACDDKLTHAKLVECLSPNRRVVVEVRGIAK
jgi:OOP family OmpA-OmpF porin